VTPQPLTHDPHAAAPLLRAGVPLADARLAVILLHGRGGSAEDILSLAPAFNLPDIAYLAPQAESHTWYPQSFLAPRAANEPYLTSALSRIAALVRSLEQAGISSTRVALAGFSQGACLATEFIASHPARYAGLIAYTGGLIGPPGAPLTGDHLTGTPLSGMPALLLSGDPDPHVPWTRVEESAAVLRKLGADVQLRRFPGRPHTISSLEIELGRETLAAILTQM
jgi:phospholipase/carboxylesterase